MRLPSFCPCPSQPMLTLLSLALLIPIPGAVSYPRFPASLLPTLASPDWETALLQLQAALDIPREVGRLPQPNPGDALWPEDLRSLQLLQGLGATQDGGGWGRGALLRSQRGGLGAMQDGGSWGRGGFQRGQRGALVATQDGGGWGWGALLRGQRGGLGVAQDGGGWGQGALLRGQRGGLVTRPLSPFPGGDSLESLHYQEGGEEDGEGGKRNEALTSIAGGLQAFSREKGGFGFRFGRK